jgi:hypothetical protein
MSHLLGLIEHEDTINKFSNLAKRVYELEKTFQILQDFINTNERLDDQ